LTAASASEDLATPPGTWLQDDSDQDAVDEADRKTVVMRAQNRLQQIFAGHLQAREGVWEWSYETDPQDVEWPPMFRATVQIPVLGQRFAGDWARGQRDAQINAVACLNVFLDEMVEQKYH
jgi:hypothetical protein